MTSGRPDGFGMFVLRAWMWAVPVVMLVAAVVFGVIAALDGKWGLLAVMVVMGLFAIGLFLLHAWVMTGMGRKER